MENGKLCVQAFDELDIAKLMEVYVEGNRENGAYFYPEEPPEQQIKLAERDAEQYLQEFFTGPDACYWIWDKGGKYISALRLEPWRDGYLLEALETHPDFRRKGYATRLMEGVLNQLPDGTKVYSHISKTNIPSLNVHRRCGFVEITDDENEDHQVTMCIKTRNVDN